MRLWQTDNGFISCRRALAAHGYLFFYTYGYVFLTLGYMSVAQAYVLVILGNMFVTQDYNACVQLL